MATTSPLSSASHNNNDNDNNPQQQPLRPQCFLPSYLADAFADLYQEDGLAVLGKGLGYLSLLAALVRFYADVKEGHASMTTPTDKQHSPLRAPLVLVLGLNEGERRALLQLLQTWGTADDCLPTFITNESGQAKDRAPLYRQGGVCVITSRILIVDLLTNICSSNDIHGIIVTHAEQVTDLSTEAFILRIFHNQKQPTGSGFIKAMTEEPAQLMTGFAKLDKILKALFVRQLYLYPRFHHSIREELERVSPIVTELQQRLTPLQQEMQAAIVAAVQTVIRELKASTSLLEWTDSELSIENCVTTNFDRAIARQLEHDWHRLKPQTKQLIQDLRMLRTLFSSLIHYDCISFYNLLINLKTASVKTRYPSLWLLTPAADVLFRKAKERVYQLVKPRPTLKTSKPVARLVTNLEVNPKWKLLRQVLTEIEQEYQQQSQKSIIADDEEDGPTQVLVMVSDERTVNAIKSYLTEGSDRALMMRWLYYLESINDRSRARVDMRQGTDDMPEEDRLLLEEEGRARRILFGTENESLTSTRTATATSGNKNDKRKRKQQRQQQHYELNQVPDYIRKRRRVAAEKGRGKLMRQSDDLDRCAVLDDAIQAAKHEIEQSQHAVQDMSWQQQLDSDEEEMFKVTNPAELRVVLKSYSTIEGDEASLLLDEVKPKYVVLYDAEISFIRSIEIYNALRCEDNPVRTFFLMFEKSAEEKNYHKSLEREQNAFERLIHHKKTMPPPAIHIHGTQEMQQAAEQGMVGGSYMGGTLPLAFDSRKGMGKAESGKERRNIAVDVREFRAALPSILHQGGMRLAPVTLTVGDFVLSNVHCVERKSIGDLFGSFNSGRLYTQAEAMCKHYKCPCLLIEFDPAKSFCLQTDIGQSIRTDSISSKMALLTMTFPKLRILWSRGPHETLRIFRALKVNHDEVDVERAMEIGRSDSVEALLLPDTKNDLEDEEEVDEINEVARDMLLRLPGVNVHIARKIMKECDSLAELAQMSRDDLRRIAGAAPGQKLFTFFRQNLD